ncbi:hypothetical protein EAI_08477 [Harpegnathos saltator]|uniref:Uncharacterized protein n=1 Tax=Harpegnathos saltator TaxID=610380 RepID=E2BPZ2_HARSA|nr:hypothetical protein EAI_08477 [Harpegnathos saltator]
MFDRKKYEKSAEMAITPQGPIKFQSAVPKIRSVSRSALSVFLAGEIVVSGIDGVTETCTGVTLHMRWVCAFIRNRT